MAQIAPILKTEPPLIEYVLLVTQRYSEKELRDRYGRSGLSFFTMWVEEIQTSGEAIRQDQRVDLRETLLENPTRNARVVEN